VALFCDLIRCLANDAPERAARCALERRDAVVINQAARLCAEAADGEVLVSGRLAAAAEAVAEVEELGERQLKGMARPVGVACLRTLKTPSN
jgi:hypothetical protein